ncbi:FeoC-like transcriptional regulator [Pragia fontium]|uniref:Probable [Fe-S]-dependent transcriptional repressor n=2 Tax=Pragia fontium TaxID=82985 RepID=A0AAJ5BI75_9GAMM|nr:FeoC-like transcriptional regulator [Pragia fontium]AKJ40882.1 ferrous iron transporter C [Pragia fontium]SFD24563.1 ferrous iron transport protein C [Pragia fontium DSM 5563 = ATCC 49100]SUB81073.1 Ferrous iron transport protein C [Pragia fontium]VEJ52990.1 Ferrous iron transport protein C [Pragia fontium]GKX64559.1 putative [Fe-S]-dependent transcriptional repressor [Pragia fontium]
MVSLIAVRDAIALLGIAELNQLSHQFKQPPTLMQAMLKQLEAMGKIERVEVDSSCLTGSCKSCPEGKKCLTEAYRIKSHPTD